MNAPRARLVASLLVGLVLCSGCASGGGGTTVFVAPDGAKATPNTGASRLADGGLLAAAGAAEASAPATVAAATSTAGTVFTWTGGGSAVSLAGEFNAWDQAADPLTRQADGSFRLVKPLAPGRYAYKFVVDGQWQADPAAQESVDDGFGGKNSLVVVGSGPVAAPPAAAAAAGPAVTPEGVRFTYAGAATSVHLAGDFNAWSTSADAMTRAADGTWTLVKALPPGTHAYKFVVDGTNWKADEKNPNTVDDGFGGKNAIVVVGEGGAAGAAPAVAAPAVAAGVARPPEITPGGVRFTYAGAARTVHLAGDFNAWSTSADPLSRGADGTWTIVKVLSAGTHAYKFVVDGTTWKLDEANPNTVDDGFGGKNAVVTVP